MSFLLSLFINIQPAFSSDIPLLGSDGSVLNAPFSVATVGNLCNGNFFSSDYCEVSNSILANISKSPVHGIVLLGDFIKSPNQKVWAKQLTHLITVLEGKPILAVPGTSEYKQSDLMQFGSSFGEQKQNIGINRYSGWQHIRIQDPKGNWTLLFLDVFQQKMGTKWREQKQWLEKYWGLAWYRKCCTRI